MHRVVPTVSRCRLAMLSKSSVAASSGLVPVVARRHASGPGDKENETPTTAAVIEALKKREFSQAQSEAQRLLQAGWREEYTLPAACALVVLVAYYWHSASYRRVDRQCAQAEAKAKEELGGVEAKTGEVARRWQKDMATRTQAAENVQRANGELTKVIDQMTTALKQCGPRGV